MKLTLLLLAAGLCSASPALSEIWGRATWNACSGDGGRTSGVFDCGSNTGYESVVFTVISDSTLSRLAAAVVTLDLYTLPACWYVIDSWGEPWPPLTSYWQLGAGGCRAGALSAANDFTNPPWGESPNCHDLWQGLGLAAPGANLLTYTGTSGTGGMRLSAAFALPYGTEVQAEAGVEYYVLRLSLLKGKTTGVGSCTGCCQQVYMCASMEFDAYTYRRPAKFGSPDWAGLTWSGSGAACLVPATNRSWGMIKTFYR